ncbi:MAG TPA: tape measure protein [Kofleriaceae bacterium]|nr:tape measure protein [Kofleriaceae bacterium]
MAFELKISFDPGKAISGPQQVEEALDKASDAAEATTKALKNVGEAGAKAGSQAGAALRETAEAAEAAERGIDELNAVAKRLGLEVEDLAGVSAQQAAEFEEMIAAGAKLQERQAAVLERIKGPLREYTADVEALGGLLKKGAINAAEYDSELGRLSKRAGVLQGPIQQPGKETKPQFVNPFEGFDKVFARQAELLERIQKPIRDYAADVSALNALFERGAISANQYDAELERLDKRAGIQGIQQPQLPKQPEGPKPISVGDAIGAFAVGGGILRIGEELAGIVDRLHEVEDAAIDARNTALKFADSLHSVNSVIDEQIKAADELNTTFTEAADLYDAVRDGTDELNISHQEQIRLQKTLGEAVQLAGKSIGAASGVFTRLSYALASGTIETRDLRGIMRQIPEIADLWTKSFGVSRRELLALTKSGTIGTQDLLRALLQDTAALDDNFKKREKTNKQKLEEFDINEKILSQRFGVSYGAGNAIKERLNAGIALTPQELDYVNQRNRELAKQQINDIVNDAKNLTGPLRAIGDAYARDIHDLFQTVSREVSTAKEVLSGALRNLATLGNFDPGAFAERNLTGVLAQFKTLDTIKGPINTAKTELQNLTAVYKSGAVNAEEYRQRYDALATTINDGRLPEVIKFYEAVNEPAKQFARDIAALNALFRSGTFDAARYNAEILNLKPPTLAGPGPRGRVGPRIFGGQEVAISEAPGGQQPEIAGRPLAEQSRVRDALEQISAYAKAPDLKLFNEGLDRQFRIAGALEAPLQVYQQAIGDINDALGKQLITQQQAVDLTTRASRAYQSATDALNPNQAALERILGPAKQYSDQLQQLAQIYAGGGGEITAQQYADAIDNVRAAYLSASDEGKTFTGALELDWIKLRQQADAFGATVANALVGDVDRLNSALVEAANGGQVAWSNLADSILQDLERIILKQLEIRAINAIIGGGGGGGSFDFGKAALSALPGFATGGYGVVGGSGGTDSQLVAFRATPGEHVYVQTPYQYAAAQGAGQSAASAQQPMVVVKVVNQVDKSVPLAAIDSPQGQRSVLNTIRANPGAVRSYSGIRR